MMNWPKLPGQLSSAQQQQIQALVSAGGIPRNRIVKRGADLINTTISTGWTRSDTGEVAR